MKVVCIEKIRNKGKGVVGEYITLVLVRTKLLNRIIKDMVGTRPWSGRMKSGPLISIILSRCR